jgi:hypothetical protein
MARSLLVVLDVSIDGDGHRRPSSSSPMRGREVWPVMGSDHFVSAEEMWWALFGVAGGAGRVVRASSSSFVAGRGLRPSGFCEIFPSIKWGGNCQHRMVARFCGAVSRMEHCWFVDAGLPGGLFKQKVVRARYNLGLTVKNRKFV